MSLVVLGYMLLPGLMFSEHIFFLTRTYVLGSYTYQDLLMSLDHILPMASVLGSYLYLPGLMSSDNIYNVLAPYQYLPGLLSLDHM